MNVYTGMTNDIVCTVASSVAAAGVIAAAAQLVRGNLIDRVRTHFPQFAPSLRTQAPAMPGKASYVRVHEPLHSDWIQNRTHTRNHRHATSVQKLTRKLVHILSGPAFLAAWTMYSDDPGARYTASAVPVLYLLRLLSVGWLGQTDAAQAQAQASDAAVGGATAAVDAAAGSRRAAPMEVSTLSRGGDADELLRGPLYYTTVIAFTVLQFWRTPTGVAVLSFMCAGDGLADVVGRRLGAEGKLPFNPEKSWAGSAAMFLGGAMVSLVFSYMYAQLGYFEMDGGKYVSLVAMAAIATVVEALPAKNGLDDNISVPLVTAVLGHFLLTAS